MSDDERIRKVEDIREYLAGRFPLPDFEVTAAPLDEHLRYWFFIEHINDAALCRRLIVPLDAIDDLAPADVTALLIRSDVETRWEELGDQPLELQYDALRGLGV